ncbi:MAG TPA: SdrD B-like domain-containing protein [Chthoniobacterales bacterium]|nr:SdrD B-like domain-containing protein [Chthoniobacterales bacterium]
MHTIRSKTHVPAKASVSHIIALLAAVLLLAALLAPSASAQFIYVANAGEDTVSKIDINPPYNEVARYATWFTPSSPHNYFAKPHSYGVGPAPSRLLEDQAGNLFVLNRFFSPLHSPVLLKILPMTGVPGTTTSNGSTNVLDINDANNSDQIETGEAKDVRIQWAQPIGPPGALGRALCIDPSGVLWVGMYNVGGGTGRYYRVDATNGQILPPLAGVSVPNGHTPYGCQVDTQGRLWSVNGSNQLVEINTTLPTFPATSHPYAGFNYSLSLFNGCGSEPSKIYLSGRGPAGRPYVAYDPQTTLFTGAPTNTIPQIPQVGSVSVGVDSQGNIISGLQNGTGQIIKTDPGGNVVWDTGPRPAAQQIPDLHGIIIDANDDVWAVDRVNGRVIKYKGTGMTGGSYITTVKVGEQPYTYGNPPPPICPCAQTSEPQIKCEGKTKDGKWLYSWSFVVTNHSPFSAPATTVNISLPNGSPVTDLTPGQFALTPNLGQNGQATVSGTFTLAQPMAGTKVCLDIRLNAGLGWCCPLENICFVVPDCACARLEGKFRCNHGQQFLDLSVTDLGPTAASGAQIFSNTPGVMVTPSMTMQNFPQNTPVIVPLTVTGATPGQVISLSVMLHGPLDEKTGVFSWCCTATVKFTYPSFACPWSPDGWIFDDVNANGVRDSLENGLPEWTVTLIDAKGVTHTTKSGADGKYQFEEIEPGKYRLSVQPPKGWRATTLKGGVNSLSVESPKGPVDFGFTKTRY